ncbi:MAG: hypothetical protein A3C02_04325 [Candidatus Andersenbacteria bacterium RIFCSPHIGHO2_02_FULL_45_11]|uniref:Lycopene cyclase domain-containing protein n=1 Tax=Candidatus Andersenbacteria bacterium RIFCSPHIGHO2_12_FULL_45_11 TaxID=1797281 RepID=A0A1G1X0F2_9BACT|nr:MAG: hypothetical protein A3C02_04325 [Candidatus Andersenbacteria bacterium RIFCSPHIGHO2_02_FULL_45_11]OGY33443.1 MAG: hypothetical protein A3D99_04855 [Candidatus Andersenbacteria bacterium RIFCSPHIGHO2_12_FULL_45_11]
MDIKLGIVIVALALLLLALLRYKKSILTPLLIAGIASAIWTTIYRYEYVGENIFLFERINIFPLTLWTLGLTSLYILQTHVVRKRNFLLLVCAYLVLLFTLEAVGYHLLNIRLVSNFPGLLNLDIIHGPTMLQIFYIAAGPAYLIVLHLIQKSSQKA